MFHISWTQGITNAEMHRTGKQKELLFMVKRKKRKTQYLGHIMHSERYELLRMVIKGKLQGKTSIGRK